MAVAGGRRIGPYELIEPVGHGGSAVVYRAYDAAHGRDVAVKVISGVHAADRTFRARFRQEADLVSKLDHPHILQVLDSGEALGVTWGAFPEDVAYLVTEYMPGGNLAERLGAPRTGGAQACLAALTIAQQIGAALDWAHAAGVLHRDVKPSNVLIAHDGRFVLGDFGLARVLYSGAGRHITATGLVAGTPAYMAPEQALGQPASASSDIYSLGVVLYEALTGRVPFDAESAMAVMLAHVHQPPALPSDVAPDVPAGVSSVVLDALAKEPAARPASAGELAALLHAAVAAAYGESTITTGTFALLPPQAAPAMIAAPAPAQVRDRSPVVGGGAGGQAAGPIGVAVMGTAEGAGPDETRRSPAAIRSAHRPAPAARARGRTGRWRAPALIAGLLTGAALLGSGASVLALGPARPYLAGLLNRYIQDAVPLGVAQALPRENTSNVKLRPTITVYFSQPMDQQSVQEAFRLETADAHEALPTEWLDFQWEGQMLQVSPQVDLAYGTTYRFVVDTTARDLDGRELGGRLERRFVTVAEPARPQGAVVAAPPMEATAPPTEQRPTEPAPAPTPPPTSPPARVVAPATATLRPPATATPAGREEVHVAGLLMDPSGATQVLDGSDEGSLSSPPADTTAVPPGASAGTPPPAGSAAPPSGSTTPAETATGGVTTPGAGTAAATVSPSATASAAAPSLTPSPAHATAGTSTPSAIAGSGTSSPSSAGSPATSPAAPATAQVSTTPPTQPAGSPTGSSATATAATPSATPKARGTATAPPTASTSAPTTTGASVSPTTPNNPTVTGPASTVTAGATPPAGQN